MTPWRALASTGLALQALACATAAPPPVVLPRDPPADLARAEPWDPPETYQVMDAYPACILPGVLIPAPGDAWLAGWIQRSAARQDWLVGELGRQRAGWRDAWEAEQERADAAEARATLGELERAWWAWAGAGLVGGAAVGLLVVYLGAGP